MRFVFITTLLLFVSAANSATVTIDFEEFAVGQTGSIVSNGFDIGGWGTPGFGCQPAPGCGTGEVVAGKAYRVLGAEDPFGGTHIQIDVSRQDDQAFALYSIDSSFAFIEAVTSNGGIIGGVAGDVGAGEWLNIVSFRTWTSAPPTGGLILWGEVDNIVVGAAVPLPASVWFFGSALAGLGWLKRKRAA
jgi:hypothetical protein